MRDFRVFSTLVFISVFSLILEGCFLSDLDKVESTTINPRIAVPLINSDFGMRDFLDAVDSIDLITTDPDGVVVLELSETLNTAAIKELIKFPDQAFSESFNLNTTQSATLPVAGQITINELYDFTAEPEEGDELDSLLTRSGQLVINLDADFPASGIVKLKFPGITDGNGNVVESDNYSWTYPNQLFVQDVIDFTGLKIDFTNGGTTVNDFKFELELTLFNQPGQTVSPANQLNMSVDFIDLDIDGLFGKIATRTVTTNPDTTTIDFFENFISGRFFLAEPSIELTFENGYGIPAGVDMRNLTAIKDDQQIPLSGSITDNPFLIGAPSVDQLGETIESSLLIDETTSNLQDMLALLPNKLAYQFSAVLNPNGVEEQNFVVEESDISINLDIQIPLVGTFRDMTVSSTSDFNGEDILKDLSSILFQVKTLNEFPFNMDLQIIFQDINGNEIDNLFDTDTKLLVSAEVDNNGEVTQPSESIIVVEIDQEKADRLEAAQTMVIRATFNSFNDGNTIVKIKEDQKLNIKVGVQAEAELDI